MKRKEPRRVWFYTPSWYWYGWTTLLPFHRGHDEYARYTIVIGWVVTGQICIATRRCGFEECEQMREEALAFEDDPGAIR